MNQLGDEMKNQSSTFEELYHALEDRARGVNALNNKLEMQLEDKNTEVESLKDEINLLKSVAQAPKRVSTINNKQVSHLEGPNTTHKTNTVTRQVIQSQNDLKTVPSSSESQIIYHNDSARSSKRPSMRPLQELSMPRFPELQVSAAVRMSVNCS